MKDIYNALQERANLLRINTINTFLIETAYLANTWSVIMATFFFTVMMLLFIEIIFSNVDFVAGYSKNQMLFLYFIGEIVVFTIHQPYKNMREFVENVRNGSLDLTLTKPLPHLFYITFSKVPIYAYLRDILPTLGIVALVINWNDISVTPERMIIGSIFLALGIACSSIILFLAAILITRVGNSMNLLENVLSIESQMSHSVPFEGYTVLFQFIFTIIVPIMFPGLIATSVMLGKMDYEIPLGLLVLIFIALLLARHVMWNVSMKRYTSASS